MLKKKKKKRKKEKTNYTKLMVYGTPFDHL